MSHFEQMWRDERALVAQLRADLAMAAEHLRVQTAALAEDLAAERLAHAETRKALEETEARWQNAWATVDATRAELVNARAARAVAESAASGLGPVLESTRAELAKVQERVKSAKAIANNAFAKALALDAEEMLEALDG